MRRGSLAIGATAIVMATTGLSSPAGASTRDMGAPAPNTVVVNQGQFRSDGTVTLTQQQVPVTVRNTPGGTKPAAAPAAPPSKLAPKLAAMLGRSEAASTRQQVVITFADDLKMPLLPSPDTRLPRSAKVNVRAQAQADALIAGAQEQRQPGYQALRSQLDQLGVQTLGTYWLIKGLLADAPLSALPALVKRGDVRYVEPVDSGAPPPADSNPNNDEEDARALMRTDPYFNLGQTTGVIGLLDTGVRATHTLFTNPTHLSIREDLTTTTNPNPDDDCWNHGTSSAAIRTGNSNLGFAFRGVTGLTVDSFKVYPAGCGLLNINAAINGFQRAVNVLDRVIVAEMQTGGNENSSLSAAAGADYNAGAVVIAANGNFGPGAVFGGTSCATPYAAGGAALARIFLRGSSSAIDPGQVYTFMIANGANQFAAFDNTAGAGPIQLSVNGSFWRSQATVTNQQTLDIPISVAATGNRINVAIWWLELPATHNDIDLSLVDPRGVVRSSSSSGPSVFERVTVAGPLAGANWIIRLRASTSRAARNSSTGRR